MRKSRQREANDLLRQWTKRGAETQDLFLSLFLPHLGDIMKAYNH
jgi:hypothetical protein